MPTKTARVVERAIDVLDVIRAHGGTAGVSEIAKEIGLPKSTVHRILVALSNKGMVRKEALSERYSFGPKSFELALSASQQKDIVAIATPYLEELRDRFGETATLGLKVGVKFVDAAYAVSPRVLRWVPTLGVQYCLHWGALGQAILAFASQEELEEYLGDVSLIPATSRTITEPTALRERLDCVRRLGYAVSFGEHEEGAVGVAAPIRDKRGLAYAGVCITGLEARLRRLDLDAAGATVAEVGRKIEIACQLAGVDVGNAVEWHRASHLWRPSAQSRATEQERG